MKRDLSCSQARRFQASERSTHFRGPLGLAVLALALGCIACGKPASEAQCKLILRKAVELELKGKLEEQGGTLNKEVESLEAELRGPMMKECVGKRISDRAMKCVAQAKSREELLEDCLR